MIFNREPVVILGCVQALLGVLAAFVFPMSAEQVGAVMAAAAAVLAIVARSQVTPVAGLPATCLPEEGEGA